MIRFSLIVLGLFTMVAPVANAADSTNQGRIIVGGRDCTIVSTMIIGSDGKPQSTTRLVCR